jgi:hypothetical protein
VKPRRAQVPIAFTSTEATAPVNQLPDKRRTTRNWESWRDSDIREMPRMEADVWASNFSHRISECAMSLDAAVRVAEGNLTVIQPETVQYALAMSGIARAMVSASRPLIAHAVDVLSALRPDSNRETFGGRYPHERMGHASWVDFVAAPREGLINIEDRTYTTTPGLGLSRDDLLKMRGQIDALLAMTEAP